MEHLVGFLNKLSKYELLNNLIPGFVFSYVLLYIGYPVWTENWVINIIVAYFLGMICSRFSSVCLEWMLKRFKLIEWRDYEQYSDAKKERPFIALLQENANMYRTLASVFILSLLIFFYRCLSSCFPWLVCIELPLLLIMLTFLFICSYRKQINDYIVKNIDAVHKSKTEDVNS